MKSTSSKNAEGEQIIVQEMSRGSVTCYVVGETPLIVNRLAEKAKRELVFPKGKKTAADKANNLKHDPYAEFQAAAYKLEPGSATLLGAPALWFKRAITCAALDTEGASKAQIGRLTWVTGELLNLYGLPKLYMAPTRSSDMNRTPDIRTRVKIKEWAVKVEINFAMPVLNATTILNLLTAAGMFNGVGDWRQQKGSANHGQFRILPLKDEKEIQHILKHGYKEQARAMNEATPYDQDTEELYTWMQTEAKARGKFDLLSSMQQAA